MNGSGRTTIHESLTVDDEVFSSVSSVRTIRREIGVFWDYENLPLPSGTNVLEACQAITKTISHFGQIRDQRLYFNFGETTTTTTATGTAKQHQWAAFDSVLDLVNTPKRNGSKETLDKKLISDVWAFAWDRTRGGNSNNYDCGIVLMSSDGDYAHTLNKLRNRGIQCIVIHGVSESLSSMLTSSADVSLSLQEDILGPMTRTSIVQAPVISPPQRGDTKRSVRNHEEGSRPLTVADMNDVQGKNRISRAISLCQALESLSNGGNDNRTAWIPGGLVPLNFGKRTGLVTSDERLDTFRESRSICEQLQWIERGYRVLIPNVNEKIIATDVDITNDSQLSAAKRGEDYMRLTERGKLVSTSSFAPGQLKSTCLFIKNISAASSLEDLVRHLESEYNVHVVLAQVKTRPSSAFWFARIKLLNDGEADLLLRTSINFNQRWLEIHQDEWPDSILHSLSVVDADGVQRTSTANHLVSEMPSGMIDHETQDDKATQDDEAITELDDAVLIFDLCRERGNWVDGVDLGVVFKQALGAKGSTKQQFRKAYKAAWDRGLVQLGRQRDRAGTQLIDVVNPDDPSTGYRPGLFFRASHATEQKQELPDSPNRFRPPTEMKGAKTNLLACRELPNRYRSSTQMKGAKTTLLVFPALRMTMKASALHVSIIRPQIPCLRTKLHLA